MRSESTSAFGQPRLTKPTFGARLGVLLAERVMILGEGLGDRENGGARKNRNHCHAPAGRKALSGEKGREFYHQPAVQTPARSSSPRAGRQPRVPWNRPR